MSKHDNPVWTLTQFATLNNSVSVALAQAIKGRDPKEVISAAKKHGDLVGLMSGVLDQVMGKPIASAVLAPAPTFNFDYRKNGWELIEDCGSVPLFSPKDAEWISYLYDGERSVGGEVMAQRAVPLKANYGLAQAEHFLAHQEKILAKYCGKCVPVFPGTKFRDRLGRRHVPYLRWNGSRWFLNFRPLDHRFYNDRYLVRPCV